MNLKEFLTENKIINRTELAEMMWPGNRSAKTKLSNKLNEAKRSEGAVPFKMMPDDEQRAKEVLLEVASTILEYVKKKN